MSFGSQRGPLFRALAGAVAVVFAIALSTNIFGNANRVSALTAGPDNASSASTDASVGTLTWSSTANATGTANTSYATATSPPLGGTSTTYYLTVTGFGFSIPAGATINGIQVDINRGCQGSSTSGNCVDNSIKIIKAGAIGGTDQSAGASWVPNTTQWDTLGGSSNLWGLTWSPSDINGSNFGVAISANVTSYKNGPSSASSTANVDAVQITVTYTAVTGSPPATPTLSTPNSGATGVSNTPQFQLSTTDPDSDYVEYDIALYQSDCSTLVSDIDQTSSETGWSGQNANSGGAYASGTTATYTYQSALSYNTTYCWQARAIDPSGTNTWSSYSATQNFTTGPPPPADAQINGGTNINGGTLIQ